MTNHNPDTEVDDRTDEAIHVGQLCAALCSALGVDPETHRGFQLTALEGNVPELVAFPLAPEDGRTWVGPLEAVARTITFRLLPGQEADAPLAKIPPPMFPAQVPNHLRLEELVARLLPPLAAIANGAHISPDDRRWLTEQATYAVRMANSRMFGALARAGQAPHLETGPTEPTNPPTTQAATQMAAHTPDNES